MKPVILLAAAFTISALLTKFVAGKWNIVFNGNLAMFIMLCFTAIGHFLFMKGMTMMVPDFVPLKKEVVYLTGIAEVLLGFALLVPQLRYAAGTMLIVLFVLMLPANVYAAINHIDYEKGTYDGSGPGYLLFRVPLQLLFIGWVWYFSIRA
jgi:uncharacterized membrane protein